VKRLNFILAIIIISISVILCHQIISNSLSNQKNKYDYAELNSVKYGLLSVDEWKDQITYILDDEINKLHFSDTSRKELKNKIEILLSKLIDDAAKTIKKENSKSAGGRIKQSFIDTFVSTEAIKEGIPEYANTIINEMTNPKTIGKAKIILKEQLEKYSEETFDTENTSELNRIFLETNSNDLESARSKLSNTIEAKHKLIFGESMGLIILAVILFALAGFSRRPLTSSRYILLVLFLIMLLVVGVTTPMIDMEAKISNMSFMLMGYQVNFVDQVLYFQSKSVLDVFFIMIIHHDIMMKFVGLLLVTFSIIFPLLKIISSVLYYYNFKNAKDNPIVKFFVLKSGKWSMADVMVIAIFMAYIGFNGIIKSQFGKLKQVSQEVMILTTNGTSLLPGYYVFVTFTLLALFLSEFLMREPKAFKPNEER
jgi:hypothetical protein